MVDHRYEPGPYAVCRRCGRNFEGHDDDPAPDPVDQLVERIKREPGYVLVVRKGDNICAVQQFMFTVAILSECNEYGYEDRWCYDSAITATVALAVWSGRPGTEPKGWHRHPASGRRRPDGDPFREYVAH